MSRIGEATGERAGTMKPSNGKANSSQQGDTILEVIAMVALLVVLTTTTCSRHLAALDAAPQILKPERGIKAEMTAISPAALIETPSPRA